MGNQRSSNDASNDLPKPGIKAIKHICEDAARQPDAMMLTYEITLIRLGGQEEWAIRPVNKERVYHLRR